MIDALHHAARLARSTSLAAAGDDFEALYKLSRLAYSDQVAEPDQLTLWRSGSE